MCNGRLVLCVLAALFAVAAGVLSFPARAMAEPCPEKQVPAAAGGFCVPGGPPSSEPSPPDPSPAAPARPDPGPGDAAPAETQPVVTGPTVESIPPREGVAGAGTTPVSIPAGAPPSHASFAATPRGKASQPSSRSGRILAVASPELGGAAGTVPVAGYLIAIGGGMLLLSAAFGLMRFRPGAR
ncbi:hypothetical protein [Arthrobacter sp. ISL-72]|uniref:hypothetical protein n=1 Tax=Arthrobacter sp. ISL-72 TaxID=2819114 RepID=UPI001BE7EEFC|nr:hypothetical protein [Arthrobacter sp. ISL-72]MBT2596990.1 hypothetical protein [Arthrobacter sp. ISL-72]